MHAYYSFRDDLDRHGLLWLGEIALFVVAAPLLLFPGRMAPLGLFLLFGQFAVRRVRQQRWLPLSPFNLHVGLFVLMAGVGHLVSTDRALSLNRLFVLLLGVGTFYTVMDYATTVRRAQHTAIALCTIGLLVAAASFLITDWTRAPLLRHSNLTNPFPVLISLPGSGVDSTANGVHPRLVAGALAVLLPLPLSYALAGVERPHRLLASLCACLMMVPLIFSQSLQAYLAVLLALSVMIICRRPRLLGIHVVGVLALVLAWWLRYQWLSEPLIQRLERGIAARLALWPVATRMILDTLFTGSGLNNFPVTSSLYRVQPIEAAPHAHNVFLQTAVDQGILGLVAFVAILTIAIVTAWRLVGAIDNKEFRVIWLGCLGGVAAFFGFGLWDVLSLGHKPAPGLWAMLGLLGAAEALYPTRRTMLWPTWHRKILVGLVALVVVSGPIWLSSLLVNGGQLLLYKQVEKGPWYRVITNEAQDNVHRIETAMTMGETAAGLFSRNARAHTLIGHAAVYRGDAEKAIVSFEQALTLGAREPLVHLRLADAHWQNGDEKLALGNWVLAGAGEVLQQRGAKAESAGRLAAAQQWYQFAASVDPDRMEAWLKAARLQTELGTLEQSRTTYSHIIRQFPGETIGYERFAEMLLFHMSESEEAVLVIEQGLAVGEAPSAELLYLRSHIAADRGDYQGAEQDAASAIEMAPSRGRYLVWMGDLYRRTDNHVAALHQYERTAATTTDAEWVWKSYQRKAEVFAEQAQWSEAVHESERAIRASIELGADRADIAMNYIALGEFFLASGKKQQAVAAFHFALIYDPEHELALERLESLSKN